MLKFLLLLISVAGFHARPLQYNDLRIQNGGWVLGAPQLVQDGQEYMGNSVPAKHPRQDKKKSEPQWEVVLAPVHKVKMQADMKQKVAPIEEHRQDTEPSKRLVVDLNTGLLKEYIVYNPVSNAEFRQGTQDSRVTLVNIRTGQRLPQLSEMQRRAEPLSQYRQGTEYTEPTLMELRNPHTMRSMEKAKVSIQEATHKSYNPASNAEFRQGTQDSRVTLVNIRTGQQLPQLSEMQRRGEPFEFKQGTEFSLVSLMNLRRTKMTSVQDMETNEVFPEFKRGIEYSQAQRRHVMDQHRFQALGSNEVEISPDFEEFGHDAEFIHANLIDRRFMEPSYVKQI